MLFRLIRLPNLIIVAVTQGLIYYQLLHKTFRNYSLTGSFNSLEFVLFGQLLDDGSEFFYPHAQIPTLLNRADRSFIDSGSVDCCITLLNELLTVNSLLIFEKLYLQNMVKLFH